MSKLKSLFASAKAKKTAAVASFVTAASVISSNASAAIDLETIQTKIIEAETSALTTGEYVIGTVTSLIVVSLIIVMVRKI